jgi:WD40 repeat protein
VTKLANLPNIGSAAAKTRKTRIFAAVKPGYGPVNVRHLLGIPVAVLGAATFYRAIAGAATIGIDFTRSENVGRPVERQITTNRGGHILTNVGVWSPNGEWIVYDTRTTAGGDRFDGERIEMVSVNTGRTRTLYQSSNGAYCGVATFNPRSERVVFILGPEHPTADWEYCAWHRQGVMVDAARPGQVENLDARDLTPPLTPGALRGGSHVHVWDAAGEWVSFTYDDHLLAGFTNETAEQEINLRNVGVSAPIRRVVVAKDNLRNHEGEYFSVLVTRTAAHPRPGSDQISRAFEEGWVGTRGYLRPNGVRQPRALAFQGQVVTAAGEAISEVFIVDLPNDLTKPGDGPLEGTPTRRPFPPRGTVQRRLTFTADRKYPGVQGPRHWLRSSPDGSQIAFLMKDDGGTVQLFTVSPNGGPTSQLTRNPHSIASAFTWSPDGRLLAHILDNSVCVTETWSGQTRRLTQRADDAMAPRPEACVFAPDGKRIAYVKPVKTAETFYNQIFAVSPVD